MKSRISLKITIIVLTVIIIAIPSFLLFCPPQEEQIVEEKQAPQLVINSIHNEKGIQLSWNSIEQANEYLIYRKRLGEERKELQCKTKKTIITDETIKSGDRVRYTVVAKDDNKVICSGSINDAFYRVCIETAHGIDENDKWDPGCSWNGTDEAKLMLPITRSMVKYLEANGIVVYTDAFTENESNLFAMLDYLDTHDVSAFVNVHCDYEYADSGTLSLYNTEEQKKLGQCLSKGVHQVIDISDRGMEFRDDLETLCNKKVHCPSCLFETGSIKDDFTILSEQYDDYVKGLAKGLCDYLGVKFNDKIIE